MLTMVIERTRKFDRQILLRNVREYVGAFIVTGVFAWFAWKAPSRPGENRRRDRRGQRNLDCVLHVSLRGGAEGAGSGSEFECVQPVAARELRSASAAGAQREVLVSAADVCRTGGGLNVGLVAAAAGRGQRVRGTRW